MFPFVVLPKISRLEPRLKFKVRGREIGRARQTFQSGPQGWLLLYSTPSNWHWWQSCYAHIPGGQSAENGTFDKISSVQEEISLVPYCQFWIVYWKSLVCKCHTAHLPGRNIRQREKLEYTMALVRTWRTHPVWKARHFSMRSQVCTKKFEMYKQVCSSSVHILKLLKKKVF